jgi:phage virion morphogenesis protein
VATDVQLKVDDRQVLDAVARLRLSLPLSGDMQPAMQRMGLVLKSAAQLRFRQEQAPDGVPWKKSGKETGRTLTDSGQLRRSLTVRATRSDVTVGSNLTYAAIHQFGGEIRPVKGRFLSIPVTPAARDAGSPRKFPGDLRVAQALSGQYILVNAEGVTQYLLMSKVIIPARPFLGVSDDDRTALLGVMNRYLEEAWRR